MQDQRWKREIVHPIDSLGDLDLFQVVTVDLHQRFNSQLMRLRGQLADESKRLRDHETTGSGLLDRVTGRIQPDDADTRRLEFLEDLRQVARALRAPHVNVNLLSGERGPQQALSAAGQLELGEG